MRGTYERVLSSRPPVEPMISPSVQKVWPRKSLEEKRAERIDFMTGLRDGSSLKTEYNTVIL